MRPAHGRLTGNPDFLEAHLQATKVELQFLRDYARALLLDTPEIALETMNPLRSAFTGHGQFRNQLRVRHQWSAPVQEELDRARTVWNRFQQRGQP